MLKTYLDIFLQLHWKRSFRFYCECTEAISCPRKGSGSSRKAGIRGFVKKEENERETI